MLGNLFEIKNTLSFNTEKLVSGNTYDYITRTSLNQGVLQTTGFVNSKNINSSGIWSLGLLQMDFFYRKKPWYAGQFVRKIIPKIEIPEGSILYFSTLLNKQKQKLLSVLVRNVDNTFRETIVHIPTKKGKIDFDFMEKFIAELEAQRIAELEAQRIAELEAQRIAELEAYLSVTGLKDTHLSFEEEQALKEYAVIDWKTFNLEKMFGKSTRGKRLKSADRTIGNLPFVTAGETDEGISAYIGNPVNIFAKNTTTIDMFGSAKYRNYTYSGDDHIAVVHTEQLQKFAAIFVTASIHKSSHTGKFDYGHNFYAKDADELNISLPSKKGQPNYKFMTTLISAIQKLVIKDVVTYSDEKIQATQAVRDIDV